MGTYTRQSGSTAPIVVTNTPIAIFTVDTNQTIAFSFDYTINRNNSFRTGRVVVATNGSTNNLSWDDDFTENSATYPDGNTGVTFSITQTSNIVTVAYTSSSGPVGTIYYSVTYLV